MICETCKTETEGIRLNGKIFCPNCGSNLGEVEKTMADFEAAIRNDAMLKKEEEENQEPAEIPSEKKETIEIEEENAEAPPLVNPTKETEEIRKLEAEEEVLELIEKLPDSNNLVIKAGRERTDRNKEGFVMVTGEPDPIEEPELPIPTEMLVEDEPEEPQEAPVEDSQTKSQAEEKPVEVIKNNVEYDVLKSNERNWEEKTFIEKNKNPHHMEPEEGEEEPQEEKDNFQRASFFTNYLKNSVENIKTPAQKKSKPKRSKKYVYVSLVLIALVLTFLGLLLYVNLYAFNPNTAIKRARQVSGIPFEIPSSMPEGYVLSRRTWGEKDKVNIVYEFVNDNSTTITIEISKLNFKEEQLFEKVVKENGQEFLNFESNGISYWYLIDKKIVFIKNDLVYQITSSAKMSKEELLKIAEGVIFGEDISG